eukprot:m.56186 g.56186  ORF g.56186 m.56186 type:complete len:860 (-) comp11179_c0_seq1:104-2683(-)
MRSFVCGCVVVLAVVAVSVSASKLVWSGGNTNFNNADNWVDGATPTADNGVSEIDMRTEDAFSTFVEGAEYSVGKRMRFPNNGKIVFDGQSKVRIKFTGSTDGGVAQFKGNRNEQEFDFNCPNNWRAFRASGDHVTVSDPPRAGDEVLFPSRNTYHVFSEQPITNVDELHIGVDFSNSEQISSCDDLPVNQFSGINCDRFFINDESTCVGIHSFLDEDEDRVCMFYNSCPTPEQELEQNARILQSILDDASERQGELSESVERTVHVVVPSMDLVEDRVMTAVAEDNSFTTTLHNALVAYNSSIPDWNIDDSFEISYTPSPSKLSLRGSVYAERRFIFGSGETELDESVEMTYMNARDSAFVIDMVNFLSLEIANLFVEQANDNLNATVVSICGSANLTCCIDGIAAIDSISMILADDVSTDAYTIALAVCPDLQCSMNRSDIVDALNDAIGLNTTEMNIGEVADLLDGLVSCDGLSTLVNDAAFKDDLNAANDATDTAEMARPADTVLVSDEIHFGYTLSKTLIHLLLSEEYIEDFEKALKEAFGLVGFADEIIGFDLNIRNEQDGTRRRATVDDSFFISATITYIVSCTPNTCTSYVVREGTPLYNTLVSAANGASASVNVQVQECYTGSDGLILDFPTESCLDTFAIFFLSENGGDVILAYNALYSLVECGVLGRGTNGACHEPPSNVPALQAAVHAAINRGTTTTTLQPTTATLDNGDSSSSTNTEGGLPLPIIAGAAGGVVVIAIIVIVLVIRNKKSSTSSTKSAEAERNVVAFENPMYEDPALTGASTDFNDQAIYNDVHDEDNEGLYDEPAFNNMDRANPLYESAPDLTELDDDDDGGYLDVAAGDDDDDDE